MADEIEQWLGVADAHGRFDYYFTRLNSVPAAQRNENLNELAAAFFLEKMAGFPISDWPLGGVGEYSFLVGAVPVFCEVKSPGWEAAFVREARQRGESPDTPRKRLPKYINAEFRPVDNSLDLWRCIEKAYPNMPASQPTLLLVVDDLQLPLLYDDLSIDLALHHPRRPSPYVDDRRPGCFTSGEFERLGGIGFLDFLDVSQVREGTRYMFRIFPNQFALPGVSLPQLLVSQWQGNCRFCESG